MEYYLIIFWKAANLIETIAFKSLDSCIDAMQVLSPVSQSLNLILGCVANY